MRPRLIIPALSTSCTCCAAVEKGIPGDADLALVFLAGYFYGQKDEAFRHGMIEQMCAKHRLWHDKLEMAFRLGKLV